MGSFHFSPPNQTSKLLSVSNRQVISWSYLIWTVGLCMTSVLLPSATWGCRAVDMRSCCLWENKTDCKMHILFIPRSISPLAAYILLCGQLLLLLLTHKFFVLFATKTHCISYPSSASLLFLHISCHYLRVSRIIECVGLKPTKVGKGIIQMTWLIRGNSLSNYDRLLFRACTTDRFQAF